MDETELSALEKGSKVPSKGERSLVHPLHRGSTTSRPAFDEAAPSCEPLSNEHLERPSAFGFRKSVSSLIRASTPLPGVNQNHDFTDEESLIGGIHQVLHDVERGARFGLGVVATGLRIAELLPGVDEMTTKGGPDRLQDMATDDHTRFGGGPSQGGPVKTAQGGSSKRVSLHNGPDAQDARVGIRRRNSLEALAKATVAATNAGPSVYGPDETPPTLRHYEKEMRKDASPPGHYIARPVDYEVDQLSFMTFNAGLLQYRLLGFNLFQNPPFTEHRLQHLPVALKSSRVDFIALQEVFSDSHADTITSALKTAYPFYAREPSGDLLRLHNGLMILSKFPITRSQFRPFERVTKMESLFASKGFLEVAVTVPGIGSVCLLNVHLASGAVDPESRSIESLRNAEIDQIMTVANLAMKNGEAPVVMGDLNAAADLCQSNYNRFIRLGMIDAFLQASVGIPSPNPLLWQEDSIKDLPIDARTPLWTRLPRPDVVTSGIQFAERFFHTWDPSNPLNRLGPHSGCAGSRCDHIFTPHARVGGLLNPLRQFYPARSEIKLKTPRVLVDSLFSGAFGSRLFTLSDHYGVTVVLRRNRVKSGMEPPDTSVIENQI